ncbi:microtubule-associated protein 6 [Nematolebias whitei]|uniref:microtubule-associated protein 6 n=1 Tax=Nematolebias whitei TaxID=451745 RepID=UPI001896D0A7|nr:microtubule-associated protein 6 [Nematolebias whitei]
MAWPCISRVCCLARFWNQFDKSDLSVPLTIQNYSDISEQEVRSVTKQLTDSESRTRAPPQRAPAAEGARGSFRARRDRPREDYQPFPSVTQYKQDYRPWPIPRKENFPWINNDGSSPGGDRDQRRCGEQQGMEESKTSSYREEYRPWTGVKPAKSVRKPPPAQYSSPGTEPTHAPPETSYQAAYSGEVSRSTGLHQVEHTLPSTAPNAQPPPATQHPPTGPQVSSSASSLQQGVLPERSEDGGTTRREEHLVKTKISRCLKPGGRFVSITFAQPFFRKRLYARSVYNWSIKQHSYGEGFQYFLFVMTKGEELSPEDAVLENKLLEEPKPSSAIAATTQNEDQEDFLSNIGL